MTYNEKVLTPAERMALFQQNTRQHIKPLPAQAATPLTTRSFELVKTRLTSRVMLLVSGTITVAHPTAPSIPLRFNGMPNFIRNIRLNINNGFNPFQISGRGLFLHNHLFIGSETMGDINVMGSASSPAGAISAFSMLLELPISLNQRDAIGLINTANPQTVVSIDVDFDSIDRLYASTAGYTITPNLTVMPVIESFTVPANPAAIPDLSILKLVHEFRQNLPTIGTHTFRLQTGLTYRRIILVFENAFGDPLHVNEIGNIELVFNQADIPYTIHPAVLRALNTKAYGAPLPPGVFVFDFTNLGIPNYGGSRDYIDTERLTEFWVTANTTTTGNMTVITETLARLG